MGAHKILKKYNLINEKNTISEMSIKLLLTERIEVSFEVGIIIIKLSGSLGNS